jgi:ATP synthase protein I
VDLKMNDKNTGLSADNVFSGMLRSQLIATVSVAVIAYVISGIHASLSAVAGGVSVVLAAFVASKVAVSKRKDAASVLGSMLKAELIKILLIVLFLYITIKGYKELVPLALIIGLAAAAIISGATMSKRNKHLNI